jgi:hypothetical protein
MMQQRFTLWMSDEERAELHKRATRLHTSDNFVARVALRLFLGLPVRGMEEYREVIADVAESFGLIGARIVREGSDVTIGTPIEEEIA